MKRSTLVVSVMALLLGALLGFAGASLSTGEKEARDEPQVLAGRYQTVKFHDSLPVWLLDTATGRVWTMKGTEWETVLYEPKKDPIMEAYRRVLEEKRRKKKPVEE